jgi:hypothetical protein
VSIAAHRAADGVLNHFPDVLLDDDAYVFLAALAGDFGDDEVG